MDQDSSLTPEEKEAKLAAVLKQAEERIARLEKLLEERKDLLD